MRKLVYFLFATVLLASCQRQAYVASVPAPKFEYYSSESKPAKVSVTDEIPATEAATVATAPTTAQTVADVTTATQPEIVTIVAPQKMTLKQKIVNKVVVRKLQKISNQSGIAPKAKRTDGIAVASFGSAIVAIVGLFTALPLLFVLGMIAAIVLGFIGLGKIKRSGGELGGRGWAIAGITLGFIELLVLILGVILVAALFAGFGA
ncbi:MAG: DUF4190 domain-containing protein [Spirosomaceae bacterium]|jgi:hypothetical protein|nr:DUF4190 domain-containing protein [Spirosomataceae bacterium]